MPLAVPVLLTVVVAPLLVFAAVWLRARSKERRRDAYLDAAREDLRAAGAEPLGEGFFRWNGRAGKVEASTNPLFGRGYSVRVAAWSDTLHEFELKRGKKVAPEFERFKPLLEKWDSAGKMFTECYAAGVTEDPRVSGTFKTLLDLSTIPLAKTYKGGTFTYREGFEAKVPQWHWRHDVRPRLPRDVKRFCFSYWSEGPLLNPVIMRVLWELSGSAHRYFITDTEDLRFLDYGFSRRDIACWGALVELMKPDMPVAADLLTDGEFFGGLLVAKDLPPGFESEGMPRIEFHEAAVKALRKCDFYARRLYDDEFSWFSGEYEIVSAYPMDVRGALSKVAGEIGAQVMDIDRRFHKRLVVPLNY
ncbi:MAG: hypothetical protein HY293_14975 [Planctomycetes bacterium]|nr:hypothetical protein [Planctomycetota bacterium]